MNDLSLKGQIAVITGGNRGIGLAISQRLAEAEAHVVLVARDEAKLAEAVEGIEAKGGSVTGIVLDLTDIEGGQKMIDEVVAQHGRIDILVNNAGTNRRALTVDVTHEDYELIMDINMRSPYFLSQAAGRHMIQAKRGKIINIASITTFIGLDKASVYAATKGGIAQMTRTMASEWGPYNVQVNAIAPGFILTDLTYAIWEREDMREWALSKTPAKRLGQPEDIAGAAHFFASSASDFVTGQVLTVDGGFLSGGPWPL